MRKYRPNSIIGRKRDTTHNSSINSSALHFCGVYTNVLCRLGGVCLENLWLHVVGEETWGVWQECWCRQFVVVGVGFVMNETVGSCRH